MENPIPTKGILDKSIGCLFLKRHPIKKKEMKNILGITFFSLGISLVVSIIFGIRMTSLKSQEKKTLNEEKELKTATIIFAVFTAIMGLDAIYILKNFKKTDDPSVFNPNTKGLGSPQNTPRDIFDLY
jgi:glucose uptake protein GlcU